MYSDGYHLPIATCDNMIDLKSNHLDRWQRKNDDLNIMLMIGIINFIISKGNLAILILNSLQTIRVQEFISYFQSHTLYV